MEEDILLQVKKPARYIGKEWNISRKDFSRARIKFAFCFPELYEVGMSNIGLRILYGLLNNIDDVACERVFLYDVDAQEMVRQQRMGLYSLESRKALQEFDIVGFSLAHELCYTNILGMLEMAGIPLSSAGRDESFPLVVGGGSSALNPEPMHDFFDLFIIGEAEEAILELVGLYRELKTGLKTKSISKDELLIELSRIEGVYAPSLYEVDYASDGKIKQIRPKHPGLPARIKKRFVKDLDNAYFPAAWIMPYIQIVHDRIAIEIMRGCPNQCRFCQARNQYFPFRLRSQEKIVELARQSYASSGYEEISLCGLSVGDYPGIEKLSGELIGAFGDKGVGVSLPSLKPGQGVAEASLKIASVRKTGLTFAPEAATLRLRRILGKDFNEEVFFGILKQSFAAGYQHVKLYFIIGLPQEAPEDLEAIVDFANKVSYLRKESGKGPAPVNLSINTLIPKPHTPFQWLGMIGLKEIEFRQARIKTRLKNSRIKLSFHDPRMSAVEAILSRGDRRLSRVILAAYKKGARLDAWGEYFNFSAWQEAFEEVGIDYEFYLASRGLDEMLPWDLIDIGVSKSHLSAEYNKSVATK